MLEVTMVFWGREQSMPHGKWLEASIHWQVDPATSSRSLKCDSEECMRLGTKAQRLERTWHVPKLHGGVG